jgi:hypothetical protein
VSGNNGINSHSLRVPLLVVLFLLVDFSEERIKTKTRIEKQKQYSTLRYFELGIIYSNNGKKAHGAGPFERQQGEERRNLC